MKTNKILLTVYAYYGKGDGEEIRCRAVIDNNKEEIEKYLDNYGFEFDEKFIKGETKFLESENSGGDWDDPTMYGVYRQTFEEALQEAENNYKKEIKKINELFDKQEETMGIAEAVLSGITIVCATLLLLVWMMKDKMQEGV